MKKDALYGPPKELFETSKKIDETKAKKRDEKREFESDDEYRLDEKDDSKQLAQLRKYEVNKMKYYYAVVHCNSSQTANAIFKENQGMEFELTNLRLSLSFVDDELDFPQKPREEAFEIPPNYAFDSTRISRALNHTSVRLTWDQDDPRRKSKLNANYRALMKKKDHEVNLSDEDAAYAGLIAGSSDSDSDNLSMSSQDDDDQKEGNMPKNSITKNNVADPKHKMAIKEHKRKKIEEMRMKLLGNLANDNGDSYGKNKRRDNNYGSDGEQSEE